MVIGVAIAVPEPHAGHLRDLRRGYGDPAADAVQTHITVAGPRSLTGADLVAVEEHLTRVAGHTPPFRIALAGTGTFRPVTDVVYVALAEGAAQCAALAADVGGHPLIGPDPYPYFPHVTLAHDVPPDRLDAAQADLAGYRVEFDVTAFGVSVYGPEGHWRPLRSFTLAGRG